MAAPPPDSSPEQTTRAAPAVYRRVDRLLRQDLGDAVAGRDTGGWATTSSLPHEIRLHRDHGVDLVRISAGAVVGARKSPALLAAVNDANVANALIRHIVIDDKILVTADMPVASLRRGGLEHLVTAVLCTARLCAPKLAAHGGRATTDPQSELVPDLACQLASWWDVLRASGTATEGELLLWLDDITGLDCWVDLDAFLHDEDPIVGTGLYGTSLCWPFTLRGMLADLAEVPDHELAGGDQTDTTPNEAPPQTDEGDHAGETPHLHRPLRSPAA